MKPDLQGAALPTALETRDTADDGRLASPSVVRNIDPIVAAFTAMMPHKGVMLEFGSGTGEHATRLASALPDTFWLPGDPDPAARRSIAAWTTALGLNNVAPPHDLDAASADWPNSVPNDAPLNGVVSMNMIHIAPIKAAAGLLAGAGRALRDGGRLFFYGPFARNGAHTAPSNAEFDASLKSRNPDWGVRDLDLEIAPMAMAAGLVLVETHAMPANNLSVVFERRG